MKKAALLLCTLLLAALAGCQLGGKAILLPKAGSITAIQVETLEGESLSLTQEEDIARLAVFTAAYDPAWTPAKVRLASFLLEECRKRLGLDPVFLERQAAEELAAMARRRKCVMDPALLEPVLEPLRKSRPSFKDTD